MFEGKAFHVEIIDKNKSDSLESRELMNFRKEAIYFAGLVVGVSGAIIAMNTISQLIVHAADQF